MLSTNGFREELESKIESKFWDFIAKLSIEWKESVGEKPYEETLWIFRRLVFNKLEIKILGKEDRFSFGDPWDWETRKRMNQLYYKFQKEIDACCEELAQLSASRIFLSDYKQTIVDRCILIKNRFIEFLKINEPSLVKELIPLKV